MNPEPTTEPEAEEPGPIQVEDLDPEDNRNSILWAVFVAVLLLGAIVGIQSLLLNNREDATNRAEDSRKCQSVYSTRYFLAQEQRDFWDSELARHNGTLQAANNELVNGIVIAAIDGRADEGSEIIRAANRKAQVALKDQKAALPEMSDAIAELDKTARDAQRVAVESVSDLEAFKESCRLVGSE